jgi:hypothetical protein
VFVAVVIIVSPLLRNYEWVQLPHACQILWTDRVIPSMLIIQVERGIDPCLFCEGGHCILQVFTGISTVPIVPHPYEIAEIFDLTLVEHLIYLLQMIHPMLLTTARTTAYTRGSAHTTSIAGMLFIVGANDEVGLDVQAVATRRALVVISHPLFLTINDAIQGVIDLPGVLVCPHMLAGTALAGEDNSLY